MKNFKKRTLALVLASVVTIAGSFANENYKNCLTGLRFENGENGTINLVVQTKSIYSGSITPLRRDANTYVITLPEVTSEAKTPNLNSVYGNISSVDIRTMPYSNGAKGYTRISIKTNNQSLKLKATNQVYLPQNKEKSLNSEPKNNVSSSTNKYTAAQSRDSILEKRRRITQESEKQTNKLDSQSSNSSESIHYNKIDPQPTVAPTTQKKDYSTDKLMLTLLAFLIAIGCSAFYISARNKMREIVGNNYDNEEPKSSKNVHQTIKKTVKTLDSKYVKNNNSYPIPQRVAKSASPIEHLEVVDLDVLFKEQNAKKDRKMTVEEENSALEDFLSGFSFNENEQDQDEIFDELLCYDENYYDKVINSDHLKFSKDEITSINKLINNEILDDTLNNIKNYAVSNPIKQTENIKQKRLEDLVTSYTINQNITFKAEDIKILRQLMNVELDNDFITNLRIDNFKNIKMETENLLNENSLKKPSEIKTLSVKLELPNLSEAIKKQGDNKVLSEYKPKATNYNAECKVKTLSVSNDLLNLTLDVEDNSLYDYKPSAEYEVVDTNYSIGNKTLSCEATLKNAMNIDETQTKPITKFQETAKKQIKNITTVRQQNTESISTKEKKHTETSNNKTINCIIDNVSMEILSSVEFEKNKGCHLAKNEDEYIVLSFINNNISKIKSYKELKSEKIQARKSEDLPNGTSRYIVRIGLNKFVLDLKNDEIKYVMDLC